MEQILEVSMEELKKIKILKMVKDGHLSQMLAAQMLEISDRQVRNLLRRVEVGGDKAIISKKRGKPSNRSLSTELKQKTLEIVEQNYPDFGPKLANEYLKKMHNIQISHETLRHWMIKAHLWFQRGDSNRKQHLPRKRRGAFGELIQVDGSHHDWFEGRSAPCVLMVFIDDATSAITSLYFAESESLQAYYQALDKHLKKYGIPLSIYGDRCAVLTSRNPKDNKDYTQFQKALRELNCKLILALSPQAKGRVERANRTLQDRLVKELRLRGISTIQEANAMLDEYREEYNKIFSKKPSEQVNAHRPLEGICLEHVLCTRETRTLLKDFIVQFRNTFYTISSQEKRIHLYKGGKVEIRELLTGEIIAFFSGIPVKMTALNEVESPVLDEKQVLIWKDKHRYIPPETHPYKYKLFMHDIKKNILQQVI